MSTECSICHHCFSSPSKLNYHTTNQVCQKLLKGRTCPLCGKLFTTKKRCLYHIEHNVCSNHQSISSDHPSSSDQPKIHLKLKERAKYANFSADQLLDELMVMKTRYETLEEHPQTTINNNQVNVFPTAYGTEDVTKIRQILGDICGSLIKHHTFESIPTLFDKIHNNQQLPEYHNVYSANERSQFAMVSDGTSFKFKPKKTVIDQIIEDKRSILNHYVDENGDQLGEKVLKKYENYQNLIDDDSEFRKNLELEIAGMLLDMKSVIADDEKTRLLLDRVDEGDFDLLPVESTVSTGAQSAPASEPPQSSS